MLTRFIELKVPEKYKSKVHTIRRYINTQEYRKLIDVKYIDVGYLTAPYWEERKTFNNTLEVCSEIGATSIKELYRKLNNLV